MVPVVLSLLFFSFFIGGSEGQLQVGFYSNTCPQVDSIVNAIVRDAVLSDPNMAAVLLRLHFHDCFVEACICIRINNINYMLIFLFTIFCFYIFGDMHGLDHFRDVMVRF
uniref:peroxidase n=1 Tax=Cajanus cajan TaxID=3821 RepID=A0A151RW53_CAJCA|nr:Peroxidase 43 [Cajanus cajan]